MPWRVRLQSVELLHAVLREDAAFEAFVRPPPVGERAAGRAFPAMQLAAALRPEAGPAQEGGDEDGDDELGLEPLSRRGAAARLCLAALRLFSSLQLNVKGATLRLVSNAELHISLPERLVSLIQAHVLALMQPDHQDPTAPTEAMALQLVRAGLYLLLEIGQKVSMQQLIDGQWRVDLVTSMGHLVRGEVHPELKALVLPAKMLQNTLAQRSSRMAVDA